MLLFYYVLTVPMVSDRLQERCRVRMLINNECCKIISGMLLINHFVTWAGPEISASHCYHVPIVRPCCWAVDRINTECRKLITRWSHVWPVVVNAALSEPRFVINLSSSLSPFYINLHLCSVSDRHNNAVLTRRFIFITIIVVRQLLSDDEVRSSIRNIRIL